MMMVPRNALVFVMMVSSNTLVFMMMIPSYALVFTMVCSNAVGFMMIGTAFTAHVHEPVLRSETAWWFTFDPAQYALPPYDAFIAHDFGV